MAFDDVSDDEGYDPHAGDGEHGCSERRDVSGADHDDIDGDGYCQHLESGFDAFAGCCFHSLS